MYDKLKAEMTNSVWKKALKTRETLTSKILLDPIFIGKTLADKTEVKDSICIN